MRLISLKLPSWQIVLVINGYSIVLKKEIISANLAILPQRLNFLIISLIEYSLILRFVCTMGFGTQGFPGSNRVNS